eukprot:c24253_g1_i1 orf=574-3063(-)
MPDFKLFMLSYVVIYCLLSYHSNTFSRYKIVHVAHAASTAPDDLLAENAVTASISRRLIFPDFRDDEKAGAITLLGSAEIDKSSGTINIPAMSKNGSSKSNVSTIQAPTDWSKMAGRALYSFPFRMMDPASNTTASFHTTFSFRMRNASAHNGMASNTSDNGLTFLVVPDELTVGRNGGWLGMMNDACDENYRPFAVEFDTFKNEEFQDPNDHHVGINYGSIVSRQTADMADTGVSLRDGQPARAWISYDSDKHLVDVRLAKEGSKKPSEPLLSVPLDLSNIFKEYMFVGFSGGASGTSGHSILSWHFSSDSTGLLRFPKEESCAKRLLPALHTGRTSRAPSAFIIFCLVILIIVLAVLNFACIPYKKKGDEVPTAVKLMRLAREKPRPLHKPRKFSLFEVLEASRLFNEGGILGYGESGTFYEGFLQDSSQVAIKRFSSSFLEQAFGMSPDKRKIEKEVIKLAQLHHPNLVPLRGWCLDKSEVLLVYDYMPNGSLDQWLFSQASIFPWIRRYKIVKELAGALAFLHSSFDKPVVHKNVKLSNVLLDVTFRAKLGDYGISSKRVSQVSPEESTIVINKLCLRKNFGYPRRAASNVMKGCMPVLPWNYGISLKSASQAKNSEAMTGPPRRATTCNMMKGCMPQAISEPIKREGNEVSRVITEEEDVYCYGVMLFEIVCGRMEGEEGQGLVEWVWNLQEEGRLVEAIDEDLRVGGSRYYTWEEEAACVLTIGLLCTLQDPSQRPSMALITKYLHGETPLPKVPLRKSIHGDQCKEPLLIYPDLSHDDYESSRYSPPSKAFSLCSPLDFYCLSNSPHDVPVQEKHCLSVNGR